MGPFAALATNATERAARTDAAIAVDRANRRQDLERCIGLLLFDTNRRSLGAGAMDGFQNLGHAHGARERDERVEAVEDGIDEMSDCGVRRARGTPADPVD